MSHLLYRSCLLTSVVAMAVGLAAGCGSSSSSAAGAKGPGPDAGSGAGGTSQGGGGKSGGGQGNGGASNGGTSNGGTSNGGTGATRQDGGAPLPPTAGTFNEDFTWSGVHSAVLGGKGTAVWWNADHWDVTGDTHAIAVMGEWSATPTPNLSGVTHDTNSGHTVYVHKAANSCNATKTGPCSGALDDATLVPGGDKSQGVGVLSLDEQDIVGARLRTPIVISEAAPGVVRLRAPRFVTQGHWWEVGLTPADRVIGSENTVVESQGQQDGLGDVGDAPNSPGKGAGPGHDPQEESFNVVVTGVTDFACETNAAEEGSLTRIAIKSLVKGGANGGYATATGERFNAWNPKTVFSGVFYGNYEKNLIRPGLDGRKELPSEFLNSDGSENTAKVAAANVADMDNLYLWEFQFRPSGVDVSADLDDGRGLVLVEHFNLGVPWATAYVHVMAVAYQNDHHPQVEPGCAFLPDPFTRRDIKFRTLSVSPVMYGTTSVFPPDGAPTDAQGNVLLCNGSGSCGRWMHYDMRDTRNWGAADSVTVAGKATSLPKANTAKFSFENDFAHGSSDHFSAGLAPEKSFDLYVPITDDVTKAKATNLVYNVLGAKGVANLSVNGHAVGALPTADTVIGASIKNDVAVDPGCPDYDCMSVRRSIAIDPKLLVQGATNGLAHLQVVFDQSNLGSGTFIDRIQLEMMR
jgi:hypothetical protein